MKRIIVYTTALAIFGVAFYFLFFKTDDLLVQVETVTVNKGAITNVVTATGTVEPITQVEVGTQVSGTIEHIYVDYNSQVKANQLIAELEKSTLQATVSEAKANLNAAINDQAFQQKNFDRIKTLYEGRVVSESEYEEALYNLNAAKITAEQRRSDLLLAETHLSYASIYSPIDGVVLTRNIDVGQTVAASYSTPTLFTIAQNLKQMQVEADVDEADIGQVKEGQRVTFTVDAYPEALFSGSVTQVRLEPTEESNVITYTVIIKAENPEGKLMPGLTASITIYTKELNDVLTLEAKAFNFQPEEEMMVKYSRQSGDSQQPEGPPPTFHRAEQTEQATEAAYKTVWVKKGNDIYPSNVTVGQSDGVNVEVINGLQENDEVVYAMGLLKEKKADGSPDSSPFVTRPPGRGR